MKFVWIVALFLCMGTTAYGQYVVPVYTPVYQTMPVYVPPVYQVYVPPMVVYQPMPVYQVVPVYRPYSYYGYVVVPGQPVRNFLRSLAPVAIPY